MAGLKLQHILYFKFYGKDVSMTFGHGEEVRARLMYEALEHNENVTDLSFNQKVISRFNPDLDKGPVGWTDINGDVA